MTALSRCSCEESGSKEDDADHHLHTRFAEKYGALYAGTHGSGWWYTFWGMVKYVGFGICLSSFMDPEQNATAMLVLIVLDLFILVVWHPGNEFRELLKNIYAKAMQVAICATILT
eukprot:2983202-Rhodomonas_salina.2